MAEIKSIDWAEIEATADSIHSYNEKIRDTLEDTRKTIQSLSEWTGQAADDTKDAYNQFANRYFDSYHELLEKYVRFLQDAAAEGYRKAEMDVADQANEVTSLID